MAAQRPAGGLFRVHTQVSSLVGAAILKHSRETQHGCGEVVFPEGWAPGVCECRLANERLDSEKGRVDRYPGWAEEKRR